MTDHNRDLGNQISISVSGSELQTSVYDKLIEIVVDSSMYVPDMFTIKFSDDELNILNGGTIDLGKEVEIKFADPDSHSLTSVIKGEITALEPEFEAAGGQNTTLVVRGYDKAHRMYRASKTKVWKDVSDADIVTQIASTNNLQNEINPSPSEVYKHVFQANQSDFEFLRARADRIGYEVLCQDGKLIFRKQQAPSSADKTLKWGESLLGFSPRLTLVDQVDQVSVRDWDSKEKKVLVGQASSSDVQPAVGFGKWGGQAAQTAFSSAKKVSVQMVVASQGEAQTIAQAILNQVNAGFIAADGETFGTPSLRAGQVVQIDGVGTKFGGKYRLSTVTHTYNAGNYKTKFTVEGPKPKTLGSMTSNNGNSGGPITTIGKVWPGVVTAKVTNVQDEDKLGRVKIAYEWLDDQEKESWWARSVIVGGGQERGIHFTPEVGDEVLVAFENGDFNRPYILGGLFNSQDTVVVPDSDLLVGSKIKTRTIKTRAGHQIKFTDEDSGQDNKIEIIDAKQKNKIVLDCKGGSEKITLDSQGKIEIHSTQDLTIKSDAKISIEATQDLSLKGMNLKAEAQTQADLKASGGPVNVQGMTASLKGQTNAEVNGGPMTTIGGALIKIG